MLTKSNFLKFLLFLAIATAFLTRVSLFTQSRDLFIDEANLARNVYEKNYVELAGVLEYEQFAPPLFLMITKINVAIFGYHEMALRLFPFICSIASIFLLAYLIHILLGFKHAIYPIALFAGGYLFIRYGTEFKQYSSDFMVTLLLLIAAFKSRDILLSWKHILFWFLLGSISIWLSMPSVFILFSIGVYWMLPKLLTKDWQGLRGPIIICIAWLVQFLLYYFLILQSQISSDYLQNYHAEAFLNFSFSFSEWIQNLKVLSSFISQTGGDHFIALLVNSMLLVIGSIVAFLKLRSKSTLIFFPLIVLILAAFLHKYALVTRLILFSFPIVLVLYAYGLNTLFKRANYWIKISLAFVLFFIVCQHQNFHYIYEKLEIQEIHYALDKLESEQLLKNYDNIWVHHGAIPAFIYYTEISPMQSKYGFENQAMFLDWDANYNSKLENFDSKERVWILLSNYFPEDEEKVLAIEDVYVKKIIEKPGCLLFQIEKK